MKNYSKKTTDVFWVGVGGGFPEYLLWNKLNHTRAGKTGYRGLDTLCFQKSNTNADTCPEYSGGSSFVYGSEANVSYNSKGHIE